MEEEIEQLTAIYNQIAAYLVEYSFQILGAIIIFIIGMIAAARIGEMVRKLCQRKNLDVTLSGFIANTLRLIVMVMVTIIALSNLGISITPFIAAVGAVSLGAGLAVQGLLSNYAAGLNIIVTRPFVVGDTITVQGVTGLVKEVHLAYTLLEDEDEVSITIPNKYIVGEILHNSQADSIVELTVGIAYSSDPHHAVDLIVTALKDLEGMSTQRLPQVGIEAFGDNGITLGVRFWARTDHRYDTLYSANMVIHDTLSSAGITFPFPQREIRMLQADES